MDNFNIFFLKAFPAYSVLCYTTALTCMILSKEYGPIVTQQFLVTKEDLISSTVVDDQGDNCHDIVHVDTQVSQGKLICYNCKSWVYQQCVIPF